MVVENTNFEEKGNPSSEKKNLTSFNSYYRLWQTSRNNLQESTSYSYQYCKNYRKIFLGPKMLLKTQIFEKKGKLFTEKNFWCRFFSFYRVWQSSRDIIQGSTSYFYHCFIVYKSIFQELSVDENTKFWEKKANFRVKKSTWPFFSVLSSMTKLKEQYKRVH